MFSFATTIMWDQHDGFPTRIEQPILFGLSMTYVFHLIEPVRKHLFCLTEFHITTFFSVGNIINVYSTTFTMLNDMKNSNF